MKSILFLLLCSTHSIMTNQNSLRIVGGRNATENEFPYVVQLMLQELSNIQSNIFICTSIVLTSTWTLTSAHCIVSVEQLTIQNKLVIVYQPTPKSESAYSEILSTAKHPGIRNAANDICLLHTQPVIFAKYGKLSSVDYTTLNGQQVFLVGYGIMNGKEAAPLHFPQVLEAIVKKCPKRKHYPQICFAPPCPLQKHQLKSLCPGDSGGPSIHPSGVISINTKGNLRDCGMYFGKKVQRDRYDAGYNIGSGTPISPFIDWISSIIKSEVV